MRKKKHSLPIKSKQTGETLALSCKWTMQEANLFALSYLIHSSPRQHSERRLCSNPPLLIPPSLHPSLLHPPPLPPSIPGYYLSSAGPCFPAHFPSEFSAKKKPIRVHRTATSRGFSGVSAGPCKVLNSILYILKLIKSS